MLRALLQYAYQVTLGAGKASHVICKVPLWPRSTLRSVNGWVMLKGAKKRRISLQMFVYRKSVLLSNMILKVQLSSSEMHLGSTCRETTNKVVLNRDALISYCRWKQRDAFSYSFSFSFSFSSILPDRNAHSVHTNKETIQIRRGQCYAANRRKCPILWTKLGA